METKKKRKSNRDRKGKQRKGKVMLKKKQLGQHYEQRDSL